MGIGLLYDSPACEALLKICFHIKNEPPTVIAAVRSDNNVFLWLLNFFLYPNLYQP